MAIEAYTVEKVTGHRDWGQRDTFRSKDACVCCARMRWSFDLRYLRFFQLWEGRPEAMAAAWELLSVERYHQRWSFTREDKTLGGIPLAELQASSVTEPGSSRTWLLHRKKFQFVWDETVSRSTADANQEVPLCGDCHDALGRAPPVRRGLPCACAATRPARWRGRCGRPRAHQCPL